MLAVVAAFRDSEWQAASRRRKKLLVQAGGPDGLRPRHPGGRVGQQDQASAGGGVQEAGPPYKGRGIREHQP